MEAFQRMFDMASMEAAQQKPILPEWLTEEDPVRGIYDRSPKEWDAFLRWLRATLGLKLSTVREEERDRQKDSVKASNLQKQKEVLGLLEYFYETVDALDKAKRSGSREERENYAQNLKAIKLGLKKIGVTLPDRADAAEKGKGRKGIQDAIIKEMFPETKELTEGNVLGDTKMFDLRYFRLDETEKTIRHTDEFRKEFKSLYGQDSELAMRRAARAMWETVKEWRAEEDKKISKERYRQLYATMLMWISWHVPSAKEMEQRMTERGMSAATPSMKRREWLKEQTKYVQDLVYDPPALREVERYKAQAKKMDAASVAEAQIIADLVSASQAEEEFADVAVAGAYMQRGSFVRGEGVAVESGAGARKARGERKLEEEQRAEEEKVAEPSEEEAAPVVVRRVRSMEERVEAQRQKLAAAVLDERKARANLEALEEDIAEQVSQRNYQQVKRLEDKRVPLKKEIQQAKALVEMQRKRLEELEASAKGGMKKNPKIPVEIVCSLKGEKEHQLYLAKLGKDANALRALLTPGFVRHTFGLYRNAMAVMPSPFRVAIATTIR